MSEPEESASGRFWADEEPEPALQRYRALVNAVDDGIYQLDAEGRFVAVNDAFVTTVGHTREALLGEHISLVVDGRIASRIEDVISEVRTRGENDETTLEVAVRTADGDWLPSEHRFVLSGDAVAGAGTSVTGVVRFSEATSSDDDAGTDLPSRTLANLLDEADVGVFVLDADFRIAWIDETIEQYFGVNREDVVGRDKRRLVEETLGERIADAEAFKDTIFATYEDNTHLEQFEFRVIDDTDGEERWLQHLSRPVDSGLYAGGRIELYYDVTEQHRRADQLERLNEAVHEWLEASSRETVAERACTHLADILNLEINGVFLYDEPTEQLRPIAISDRAESIFGGLPSFSEEDSIAGRVFESGESVVYADVRDDPDVYNPDTPIRSEIVLPLGDHGVVIIGSEERDAFDDGDLNLANVAASTLEVTFDRIAHQRRLEARADELETELEEIYGRITNGFIALNQAEELTHINARAEEILGVDERELLGANIWESFPELRGTAFEEHYREAMRTQRPVSFEAYFPPHDAWYEEHVYPSETGLSVYIQDVTENRERDRELRRKERRYEAVFQDPNILVGLLEPDGTVLEINETALEYVDVGLSDVAGEPFWETPWWDEGNDVRSDVKEWTERAADGEYVDFEVDLTRPDGQRYTLRGYFRPVTNDDGEVVSLIVSDRDITERKRRERKLERRARQQQAVADLGQFALETSDLDELMSEAARLVADVLENEYCKMLDFDPTAEELLLRQGVGWKEGIVGEATVSAVEADSQAAYTLANDHPIVVEDLETETRFSGPELLRSHDVKSGISTVIGPFDEPWGILGTHDTARRTFTDEDVNFVQSVANVLAEAIERHRYQRELEALVADLEESNKRLEQFAYAASHDLQEPLRMVSSYLRLIENRYKDALDEDGEEFLEFAVDGADRMREMISGLLKYSRVETRGDPFEPIDLNAVLEEVLADLQVRIEESDAKLAAEVLPTVEGDASQLRQLFQNLLDNAIEYSGPEPPRIDVSADREDDEWIISVRDEGIGIDPDDADRVFEVFQSLHSQAEYGGTGIGLALCERIIERHGGDIWVDTEPGAETTFSFTLPAADASDEE